MRKRWRRIAVSGLMMLAGGMAGAQAEQVAQPAAPELTREDLERWLDGLLPYAIERADIAGAVVLVVKDGEILLQKGYGYADLRKRIPMDPERTLIEVASVTKAFTWTAVMQLVEQGRIDLDRDINDYLDVEIPATYAEPITMRHLMTHTAGFEERLKSYAGPERRSLQAYLKATPVPERIYPPGRIQAYSNYGTILAGYIVERVSGEPFETYVEKHILRPLGMQRSTLRRPLPDEVIRQMAVNYGTASSGEPLPADEGTELLADPSGNMVTTAQEMSYFMRAHLQQGRFGDYQLLKPETIALMHAPAYVPVPGSPGTALGLFGADYNGRRILVHDGDGSGDHSDMQLLLDEGVGFFSHFNSDGRGGLIGASYWLRASLLRQFMDRYFPAPPSPEEPTVATAREHARQVAGEYWMSRRPSGDFMQALYLAARIPIVAHEDGTIETPALLNLERGRPQRWREVGPYQWREVNGRARLSMKVEDGQVRSWLPLDLSTFELEPVPAALSAAWNVPLFLAACVVILLWALLWPVSVLVRRHYGRPLQLEPRAARAYRLARVAAVIAMAFLLGWVALAMALGSGIAQLDPNLDPWIRLVQSIGLVAVAGTAAAAWNAWLTWSGRRSLGEKLWSLALLAALVDLGWFSFAFGLISPGLNY